MGLPAQGRRLTGLLVVCAVAVEREAVLAALPTATVLTSGVGPAAAAAATAHALAGGHRPRGVISAGIAGGYAGSAIGVTVVADPMVAADLGVQTDDSFLDVEALGFGNSTFCPPGQVVAEVARRSGAAVGTVLTLSSATGTASRAADLARRYTPLAEAMEGTGVATAAAQIGLPVLELRAISNPVGHRDLSRWDLPRALAALTAACASAFTEELPWDS